MWRRISLEECVDVGLLPPLFSHAVAIVVAIVVATDLRPKTVTEALQIHACTSLLPLLLPLLLRRICDPNQTLSLRPSASDPQPQTLNPRPSTSDPQPQTLSFRPSASDPQPQTLNLRPSTSDPQPQTLHLRPSASDPQPHTLNPGGRRHGRQPFQLAAPYTLSSNP